ncbi:MAG: hypothetical protein ABI624_17350 [Casimicrobiaceae bacterium]
MATNTLWKAPACAVLLAERVAKNDPRLSLEERYPSFTAFYYQAVAILNRLVAQRYLLPKDASVELNAALAGVLQDNLLPKDALAETFLVRRTREEN